VPAAPRDMPQISNICGAVSQRRPVERLPSVEAFTTWPDERLLRSSEHAEETFAVFYRRHIGVVMAFYAKRGVDPSTAGDLTAETFAAALLARRRFKARHDSARPWLLRIASSKLADHARRGAREENARVRLGMERVELTSRDRADYEQLTSREVDDRSLFLALEELPEAQRRAVESHVLREDSYSDIAHRLGSTETAVRQNVSRGLSRLRARLERDQ
jgi:RNA polymerase sigma-70 factor (ECF subfamily)